MPDQISEVKKPVQKVQLPKPGDFIQISMRARVIQIGPQEVQIEIEELLTNGIVEEPVYLWAPTALIEQEMSRLDTVNREMKPDPAWNK